MLRIADQRNEYTLIRGRTTPNSSPVDRSSIRAFLSSNHAHSASRAFRMGEHVLKSDGVTPPLDASKWPLLLKNYDKMMVSAFLRIDYHQTKLFAVR